MDEGDVADQIITERIKLALENRVVYQGESAFECDECSEIIPEQRRILIPGTRLCVSCQSIHELCSSHYR